MKRYLEAGKLINTHGVRGEFKFDAWCDDLANYLNVEKFYLNDDGSEELKVSTIKKYGKFMLVKFNGIESLDQALNYKGRIIYIDRKDVPKSEGAEFIADIIGLPAIDIKTNTLIGRIINFTNKGSGNLYEIELQNKNTCYIPAIDVFVKKIDINTGVYFELIEGLVD